MDKGIMTLIIIFGGIILSIIIGEIIRRQLQEGEHK